MVQRNSSAVVFQIGIALIAAYWSYAQPNVPTVQVDTVWVGQEYVDTVAVVLPLPSNERYRVVHLQVLGQKTPFMVTLLDSNVSQTQPLQIVVQMKPRHNLEYHAVLNVQLQSSAETIARSLRIIARCYYPEDRYRFTWNLQGAALVDALYNYLKVHRALFYSEARRALFEQVAKMAGDTLECVYSGRKIVAKTYSEAYAQGFNTEHVWPRSYGADREPAKSDLHHLFPSDQQINEQRANYPFGFVTRQVLYEEGGSKLGYDAANHLVFEVRPQTRGDIARAMFYFAVRYRNPENFLQQQEAVLRQWHQQDPVDSLERLRNQRILAIQYRPNPFIDHPEFLERIYQLSGNPDFPRLPLVQFADSQYRFQITHLPDTVWIPLYNFGTAAAVISGGTVKGYQDSLTIAAAVLPQDTLFPADVAFVGLVVQPKLQQKGYAATIFQQWEDTVQLQVRFRGGIRPVKVPVVLSFRLPTTVMPVVPQRSALVALLDNAAILRLPGMTAFERSTISLWDGRGQTMPLLVERMSDDKVLLRWRMPLSSGVYWIVWQHAAQWYQLPIVIVR